MSKDYSFQRFFNIYKNPTYDITNVHKRKHDHKRPIKVIWRSGLVGTFIRGKKYDNLSSLERKFLSLS